jgi:fatty acid desaturase
MVLDVIWENGLDRATVRRLSRRSDARGLAQLGAHTALLCATGCAVWASRGSVWFAPAVAVHGIALSFLFCPLHESIHRTAFASRWINDSVAWLCGALLLLPPKYFRLFHFAHHRFTQSPEQDPELAQAKPAALRSYLWHISGLPYWYNRLTVTLRHALTGRVPEAFVPPDKRAVVVREARILLSCCLAVIGVSLLLRRTDVLIYWVLPALLGQPLLRLFLLAEHAGCAFGEDMFANTRTTYTNSAVRFLTWQMSFHAEHHAFPSVPFHALAAVNALTRDRLASTAAGYFALHRCLVRQFGARGGAKGAA